MHCQERLARYKSPKQVRFLDAVTPASSYRSASVRSAGTCAAIPQSRFG
jgi:hypothetical protein